MQNEINKTGINFDVIGDETDPRSVAGVEALRYLELQMKQESRAETIGNVHGSGGKEQPMQHNQKYPIHK